MKTHYCEECGVTLENNDSKLAMGCCHSKSVKPLKVIASYAFCNTGSVNIYEVDDTEQMMVRAGINDQDLEWYNIENTLYNAGEEDEQERDYFEVGAITVYLDECMKVGVSEEVQRVVFGEKK